MQVTLEAEPIPRQRPPSEARTRALRSTPGPVRERSPDTFAKQKVAHDGPTLMRTVQPGLSAVSPRETVVRLVPRVFTKQRAALDTPVRPLKQVHS